MSRSGYTDDYDDDDPLALGRYRQAVHKAIKGKRGQALLRELVEALDAMPVKELHPGSFATPSGEFCALGALAQRKGIRVDDLGSDDDDCDPKQVGQRFGIAQSMAAEIMYLNDEYLADTGKWIDIEICGPMRPHYPDWGEHRRSVHVANPNHPRERWERMRAWAVGELTGGAK
jgi:hypothetical protein